MLFFQAFGVMVSIAPQTRLFEDIACRRYFGSGGQPDEESCKDPAVQDTVNELFGWQLFFDGIPGLIMAMYYGAMADEKGRKPVLVLSLVGQALGAAWILLICMCIQAFY
jgi:MFS family permease